MMNELIKALKVCQVKDCENCEVGKVLLQCECENVLLGRAARMLSEVAQVKEIGVADVAEASIVLKGMLARKEEKIERLENALSKFALAAAEYGIDAHTMLELAKSQIATVKDNCELQHENESLKEEIARLEEESAEAYRNRDEHCDGCGLVYEVSRSTYEIPDGVSCVIDNDYCPKCGRKLKKEPKSETKQEKSKETTENPTRNILQMFGIIGG